jgi:hypothetical protein
VFRFAVSVVLTLLMTGVVVLVMKRRPVDAPLTWGEAMVAATWVFAIFTLTYGIVPHQWLTWADSDLGWRPDKIFVGPGRIVETILPFTVTYLVLRDLIATVIYIVFFAGQIALWAMWQGRGKAKPKEIPTSAYGRPLVKKA